MRAVGEEDQFDSDPSDDRDQALLASLVGLGAAGFSAGCGDSNKSDGQIETSPEASNAAQAVAKNYSEQMLKKYAGQASTRRSSRPP